MPRNLLAIFHALLADLSPLLAFLKRLPAKIMEAGRI
ncbi:hypothetical protein J2Z37_002170 [Ammoniphilus resinae]|uniref:Uncharacterized protein n=1 Tax=Ammoniphilus resinae TaxID=861532 RepID=A0ABS4GPI1_9BACL|nr:hypothetical protein [Ammoniphilus resinae]